MSPSDNIGTSERLVRLETKLDNLLDLIKDKHEVFDTKHADYEKRLKALETWVNRMFGGLVVLNVLLTVFSDKLQGIFT